MDLNGKLDCSDFTQKVFFKNNHVSNLAFYKNAIN